MSNARDRAIDGLQAVGLTAYEARCYVSLSRVSAATAAELSQLSGVPRSRVYDVTDSLHDRGLLEVQPGSPQTFRAVPTEMAESILRSEYLTDLDETAEALSELEEAPRAGPSTGVWSVTGRANVLDRVLRLLDNAQEELVYVVGEHAPVGEDCLEHLSMAADRGVAVRTASADDSVEARMDEHLSDGEPPGAGVADAASLGGSGLARLLLVDRDRALVASVAPESPAAHRERCLVGEGPDNGLVELLRLVLDSPHSE